MFNGEASPQTSEGETMDDLTDAELVAGTRAGDASAFAELYRRHWKRMVAHARKVVPSDMAEDVTQEAFANIYEQISTGGGPVDHVLAYLYATVRHTAIAMNRKAEAERASERVNELAAPEPKGYSQFDIDAAGEAMNGLPDRWQDVLVLTEVLQVKPAAAAPQLGLTPLATSQLAFRAREGLRAAWISCQVQRTGRAGRPMYGCATVRGRLGAVALGTASRRTLTKVSMHVAVCRGCALAAREAAYLSFALTGRHRSTARPTEADEFHGVVREPMCVS